jgi:hypothetical protein
MPVDKRVDHRIGSQGSLGTAPYLAKIVGHLDPEFQGGLEVSILRSSGNEIADENQTYPVKYASPFYGTTAYEFMGKNVTHDDTQKSYGFWGVPPDVGVTGIVIFIEGDPGAGYWLGCVQDKFANHMIPAIGGTTIYQTDEDFDQAEHPLPVSEHNRRANELDKNLEIDKIPRAVHPIARIFKSQGLIRDEFRGTATTTTRRDVPNLVFGMSSPGPLDRAGKRSYIGTKQSKVLMPVSRLGGSQFVMDDGDDRYFREKSPSEGPPTYLKNPAGDKNIPYSEYFRLRTRTGHQILMHNSEDLIYIANARGTTWVEITSDGKIDIFATDSINIRTKEDFNFYADRDFNFEAGRNFNIKVGFNQKDYPDAGEMQIETRKDYNLMIGQNGKITVGFNGVQGPGHLETNTKGHIYETSGESNETRAGPSIIETAGVIHMNGPAAATAEKVKELKVHKLPDMPIPSAKDDPVDLITILRRVPTPESYPHHENLDPKKFKPDMTDRDIQGRNQGETSDLRQPPTDYKKYKKPGDTPF